MFEDILRESVDGGDWHACDDAEPSARQSRRAAGHRKYGQPLVLVFCTEVVGIARASSASSKRHGTARARPKS